MIFLKIWFGVLGAVLFIIGFCVLLGLALQWLSETVGSPVVFVVIMLLAVVTFIAGEIWRGDI